MVDGILERIDVIWGMHQRISTDSLQMRRVGGKLFSSLFNQKTID